MMVREKYWFNALAKDRAESANTLEKPSMRGVQRSVVDKYSDQAHFIYELLQNADDVRATSAHFRLERGGLYFTHNGSIHFSVSDPLKEDEDVKSGALGHINSITSIANSNKTTASIGKFGVGFKAVFQYTRTPHIYDPGVQFRIERFIVPYILESDFPKRNAHETVFWFPFDHASKPRDESFEEILEKLKALELPTLFLSNLCSVSFECNGLKGEYAKTVTDSAQQGDIEVKQLKLTLQVNGDQRTDHLITFSRLGDQRMRHYVGYALKNGASLTPLDKSAFCFFPTKEVTNLRFIVHAPFLLTDSREGIKAGEKHNQDLIEHLSRLAADSLPVLRDRGLIDDGIFEIIPYDESKFSELNDRRKLSFKPLYAAIKAKLQSDRLLPAAKGTCAAKHQSYWASDAEIVELFSDEQLSALTGRPDARWVLRSRGKKEVQSANRTLADYVDGGDARTYSFRASNLIASSLDPETLLRKIDAGFIAEQSHAWLHQFYAYLSERASYQDIVKQRPIFLDDAGNAVAAFDEEKQLILFMPHEEIEGYVTINKQLLKKKATREFVEKFGVKRPSLRDEIYNRILPAYENESELDTNPHFRKFFQYFKECKHDDVEEFIELIRSKPFIRCSAIANSEIFRDSADSVYIPTDELRAWFWTKPDTQFVLLEEYRAMVGEEDHERLDEFFRRLGVASAPRIIFETDSYWRNKVADRTIDGIEELLSQMDGERSVTLWNQLVKSWTEYGPHTRVRRNRYGPRGGIKGEAFHATSFALALRTTNWIRTQNEELVTCEAVTIQSLYGGYDTTSFLAKQLIAFLNIRDEAEDTAHLSEEEARKIKLVDELENSGLSEEEIRAVVAEAKRIKETPPQVGNADTGKPASPDSEIIRDINQRRPSVRGLEPSKKADQSPENADAMSDTDECIPKPVDFRKKLERAKDRQANEIDRLEREQALHDKANSLPRYSYGWFLALLELESLAGNEKSADAKTISISFARVERDSTSARTIILKEPSRFIPQMIEELSGVRVDLEFNNGRTGRLRIESFTAREFSLMGKVEDAGELNGVDLSKVVQARIEVQNPSFLFQELLNRFRGLNRDEAFDMKSNLTPKIEFIFGPPGTGKTTYLAEKILIPSMRGIEKARVLVLTPTNKAADVLTARVIEKMGSDTSYLNWLVRFGTSADERIERAGVWRDKSFNIEGWSQSVTVTTIARFAYDGFTGANGKKLYQMDWDVIVVDEASMVSLAHIIYPLFQQTHRKFIIAGDPFQIEPIVAVDQWKDENIYTMVGLNKAGSFTRPMTEPHRYPIVNLKTQYRSVSAIGEVFSRFTYDGVLKHHRAANTQRPLSLEGMATKPLNIIKFPVSKYESIYRAKRLESGTSYQAYSALFAFEFVRWVSGHIGEVEGKPFRIGVIAPYRAQANLVNKLVDSWVNKPKGVEMQIGTIHGFQGDECDAIIALFNPPPSISADPRMFLNKQNILNVAISRARDYLFIVMPDDDTEGVENLRKIAAIEALARASGEYAESTSHDVEELIWSNRLYLEENTFSTGHQMVNVYRKPERYYEVRSDESAIDVQIHEIASSSDARPTRT